MSDKTPGKEYSAFIEAELKIETDRKSSLEQRGLAVITTTGVVSALLFAAPAAVGIKVSGTLAPVLVAVSFVFLVLAAIGGLLVAAPQQYPLLEVGEIDKMLSEELWLEPSEVGTWEVAKARRNMLELAQRANTRKARRLQGALTAEVVGIAALLAAIVATIA